MINANRDVGNVQASPDLSICIVNWNACETLTNCIDSIKTHSEGIKIEIIVVDNASVDGSIKTIEEQYPEVRLIKNISNIGFGAANNSAIYISKGNYILLLNPDILLLEPVLQPMIKFMDDHPDAGVMGCKLINQDGSLQQSFSSKFLTPFTEFLWASLIHNIIRLISPHIPPENTNIEVAWIAGACMLFKKDVLLMLGGFDRQYFMYAEDMDLCYRIWKKGLKVYYLGTMKMLHYGDKSSNKQKFSYFSAVLQKESGYQFIVTHYGKLRGVVFRITWLVCGMLRVIVLSLLLCISFLFIKKCSPQLYAQLIKNVKVVFWSLGLQKWSLNPSTI